MPLMGPDQRKRSGGSKVSKPGSDRAEFSYACQTRVPEAQGISYWRQTKV